MLLLRPPALPPPRLCRRPPLALSTRRRIVLSSAAGAESPPAAALDVEEPDGPVEISPFSTTNIFATGDDPTPLQTATSVLLTGAISVFLFRSLRRRARRAKELRMRSTGAVKAEDEKRSALDNLRALGVAPLESNNPPSPVQAFLGGIAAGVITLILYKFTTTIEAALNRQAISDSLSVRQITITIRTIVNGLCYLATFVFGINSAGLILYSFQLALASLMSNVKESSPTKDGETLNPISASNSSNVESTTNELQQVSEKSNNSTE